MLITIKLLENKKIQLYCYPVRPIATTPSRADYRHDTKEDMIVGYLPGVGLNAIQSFRLVITFYRIKYILRWSELKRSPIASILPAT